MSDIINQTAYCLTYGYITGKEECIEEPSLIQNSPLITEELIGKFLNHPKIQLITLSTGNDNMPKSIMTFRIEDFDDEQYNLFITQMSNNSNGLYQPELKTTTEGSFLLMMTNNREKPEHNNDRLQRWILSSFDVINNVELTTRNFVKNNREQYNLLISQVNELKTNVNEITEIIDNGQEQFTEKQQVNVALGKLSEDVAANMLKRAFQTTAVRDITLDANITTPIIKRLKTDQTNLSISHNVSNFDNTTNNILQLLENLSRENPENIKQTILTELTNLKDIPKDYMDFYTNSILTAIDKFPFSSIDKIKGLVLDYSNELANGPISDSKDFITTVDGELLTATNTSMEKFGITAASSIINQISQPGFLENIVRGYGSQVIDEAMLNLPIEDMNAVTNDIKTFSNYVDLGTSDEIASLYASKLSELGLNKSEIDTLLLGIDNQLADFDKALIKAESETGNISDLINSLYDIGPALQNQFNDVFDYVTSAFDFISGYNIVDLQQLPFISSDINRITDMINQFRDSVLIILRLCGAGNPPGCVVKYGVKDMGLV